MKIAMEVVIWLSILAASVLVVVYIPVALYADAECLKAGYPKARVSIGLDRYCTTLDGAVTVKVQKQ